MSSSNPVHDTRGAALIVAVMLVAVLGIGGATAYSSIHRVLAEHRRFEQAVILSHLADAGLDQALAALSADPTGAEAEFTLALETGRVHVTIQSGRLNTPYRIHARAELHDGSLVRAAATYTATARIAPGRPPRVLAWQREKRQP